MNIIYCLPIIKNNKQDVLAMIKENNHDYHYFEVWVDYVEDLDGAFIKTIQELLQERLIIVFRRKNLEHIQMSFEKRFEIITLLDDSAVLLDLDIAQKEEMEFIKNKKKNIQIIGSYHNYIETPSDSFLAKILGKMRQYSPVIFKISTFCQTESDAMRLLNLQDNLVSQRIKHIVLGMGEFGTITRVLGTLWGNEMIFAPKTLEEQSADGQLTRDELEAIFTNIH